MSTSIPNPLTPSDITTTLRSLPRRFGAILHPIDERDPLFRKMAERTDQGWTPAELARACLEDLRVAAGGVERATADPEGPPVLVELGHDGIHGDRRGGEPDALLAELSQTATDLADLIDGLDQEAFGIETSTAKGTMRLIDVLRLGVDGVTTNLRALERVLDEAD